jgi:hypothetical protein
MWQLVTTDRLLGADNQSGRLTGAVTIPTYSTPNQRDGHRPKMLRQNGLKVGSRGRGPQPRLGTKLASGRRCQPEPAEPGERHKK